MSEFHLDFETYSAANLKKFGAHRYASDPTTEILMFAIARDDEEPLLWTVFSHPGCDAAHLLTRAIEEGSLIYAHNAQFEAAISENCFARTFGINPPDRSQWRCTQAMCRRAAIEPSLEKAGAFLKLDIQKDPRGKALIKKFSESKNGKRTLPSDDKEAFKEFGEYCIQDVRTEREIHRKLSAFELTGEVLESFQFDMRMNFRGVPVNVGALEKTDKLVNDYQAEKTKEFREITDLNPTQRDKVLVWLQRRGYTAKNLQADTVTKEIDNAFFSGLRPEALQALKLKSLVGFAAVKKIPTMLGAVCPDGTVKGSLIWSGAVRTHRWAGAIIQPQNFRKPTVDDTELAYGLMSRGCDAETLDILYGSPLEVVASCIRHFIQREGSQFLDADFSAIEARICAWLCGAEGKLRDFREGALIYEIMGALIFGKPISEIGPKSLERFVGKTAELGCGYQMGGEKFQGTCSTYGQDIPLAMADRAVAAWRKANPKTVEAWRNIGNAAKEAIRNPGKTFKGTHKISFAMTNRAGFPALIMILPSGHKLVYPYPTIEWREKKHRGETYRSEQIEYHGKVQDKQIWGRVGTYGGKLLENATQAVAGDIMSHGALVADKAGFEIFMLVHDQALAHLDPKSIPEEAIKEFIKCLCTLPRWADGLPIEAEGEIVNYYKKT